MERHLRGEQSIEDQIQALPKDQIKGAQSAQLNGAVLAAPQNPELELFVEQEFWLNDVWTGFIDLIIRRQDGSVTIHDHKFTADRRWIPTVEELQRDPQTIIYAKVVSAFFDLDSVTCQFDYYGTRTKFWEPRCFMLTRAQIAVQWAALEGDALNTARNYIRRFDDTIPNFLACRDYGGCEYAHICHSR